MRGAQLIRQWKIIRILESRKTGITGAELAAELKVPSRTLYRDLDALLDSGFPLYTERVGKNSYWYMIDTFKKKLPLPLTATELMALHMSRDLLGIFQGTIFHESIETLFEKVKTVLSPETLRYLENISGRLSVRFAACKDMKSSR